MQNRLLHLRKTSPKKNKPFAKTIKSTKSSEQNEPSGHDLFEQLVKLTGLKSEKFIQEMKWLIERKNLDVANLTIDQLRLAAASYLRELVIGLKSRYKPSKH